MKITNSPSDELMTKPIISEIGILRDESLVSSATCYERVSILQRAIASVDEPIWTEQSSPVKDKATASMPIIVDTPVELHPPPL